MVLRIGSMDYEACPRVKPYTLDQKFVNVMNCHYLKATR